MKDIFVISLLFWVIAIIALKGDFKNPTNRWFSATAFFSGFGGIPVVWRENILPNINYTFSDSQVTIINYIFAVISTFPYYVAPYPFLMLGITYGNLVSDKWKKRLALILIIPTVLMYIIFPIKQTFKTSFSVLCIWVVPYIVFANILIVRCFLKEKTPIIRRQKLYISVITVPVTMYALITSYIVPALGGSGWRLNFYITIFQFTAFIYILVTHGVMGVKINFEKNNMDTAMKAVTSGNAIVNHAIKNQITKILMSVDNLNANIKDKNAEIIESIDVISESTIHMLEMIQRIKDKTSDIVLKQEYNNLSSIIDQALNMVDTDIYNKNIILSKSYNLDYDIMLYCDPVHVKEIIINVIKNSIDAVDNGGKINIGVYENKKWIFVEIKDNGRGIPKEYIHKVIQPFFSTKSHKKLNFGLGLSYSYNIMQKHEGSLEIKSAINEGTAVYLNFPKQKSLKQKSSVNISMKEGVNYVQN